jgi:Zn-dependent peptidase ImmA (M78 family)/transcriptional regulator with XRE-family HTH domain
MKAHINKSVLRWARDKSGLSLEEAARRARIGDTEKKTAAERLEEWESGEPFPTRRQAENLARAYYRPIVTFYLKSPPVQSEETPDFRTVGDHATASDGNVLAALLRRTRARQREIVELLTEDEDEVNPLPFVGRFRPSANASDVAADIRREIGIDFETQRSFRDRDTLFRGLRRKAEDVGIFVLLQGNLGSYHTDIEPEEFRGIALVHPIAPFIVVNGNDAKAAHTFTLLHELAHIWIGQSGISNLSPFSGKNEGGDVETFCNLVAAEFLMPEAPFQEVWRRVVAEDLNQAVAAIAEEFSISRAAAANRLWKLDLLQDDQWWGLYRVYRAEWKRHREKLQEREGGPGYYVTKRSQLGNALIRTVLGAVDAGSLTYTRASRILGVNTKNFDGLRIAMG